MEFIIEHQTLRTFLYTTASIMWMRVSVPKRADTTTAGTSSGIALYTELHASSGTWPYFPGTAVVQAGKAPFEVAAAAT